MCGAALRKIQNLGCGGTVENVWNPAAGSRILTGSRLVRRQMHPNLLIAARQAYLLFQSSRLGYLSSTTVLHWYAPRTSLRKRGVLRAFRCAVARRPLMLPHIPSAPSSTHRWLASNLPGRTRPGKVLMCIRCRPVRACTSHDPETLIHSTNSAPRPTSCVMTKRHCLSCESCRGRNVYGRVDGTGLTGWRCVVQI